MEGKVRYGNEVLVWLGDIERHKEENQSGHEEFKKTILGVQVDVSVLKTDVAILKTDVAILKTDVAILKTDVSEIRKDLNDHRDNTELHAGERRKKA
jgi:N-dimethylarginine dimethylaminohydrolase